MYDPKSLICHVMCKQQIYDTQNSRYLTALKIGECVGGIRIVVSEVISEADNILMKDYTTLEKPALCN